MSYLTKHINTRETSQREPLPGTVLNSAGGYSFEVDHWTQLRRFLILGTEGGTYYASERDITRENYDALEKCIAENPKTTVDLIVSISEEGRAPKNDPALFALAVVASKEPTVARLALDALPKVARTGTHLFHFVSYVQNFRGWGRALRTAVGNWYTDRTDMSLAAQLLKYQSRDGWSHQDVLRLAHPSPKSETQSYMFSAVTGGTRGIEGTTPAQEWFDAGQRLLRADNVQDAVALISNYKFPRELVPTGLLNSREVWEALLPHMGLTAMIRNLNKMTAVGLVEPLSEASAFIGARLADKEALKSARVHPIQVLMGRLAYAAGFNRNFSWRPVPTVVDALEAAYYGAFGTITRTGKNFVLGIDISGSMNSGQVAGIPGFTPRIAAAAMAMVTARSEPNYAMLGFHHGLVDLGIQSSDSLEEVVRKISRNNNGGTDCSLLFREALAKNWKVDTFVTYTDSETWAGPVHPAQALRKYRDSSGVRARSAVVGLVANRFTIADPKDAGMLDVAGFDTSTPEVLAQFSLGNV